MAEPVSEATSEDPLVVAEPTSEATSEELLGTEETTEVLATEKPKQKKPRCSRLHLRRRRRRRGSCAASFATYFPRVIKRIHEGLSLSQETVSIMDSFVKDIIERITEEASRLPSSTRITSDEIQTAVRLLLPGELGKYAVAEGTKAVILHIRSK